MMPLDLNSTIGHAVDGLVNHDGSVRLLHDFVYLMPFGSNEKGHHSLRHEDDNAEALVLELLELLMNFSEEQLGTLVLAVHLPIIDLASVVRTCTFLPWRSGIVRSAL